MKKLTGKGLFYVKGIVLSLVFVLSLAKSELPVLADTEEADLIQSGVIDEEKYEDEYVMTSIQLYAAGKSDIAEVRNVIYQALLSRESKVSIEKYQLTVQEVSDAFSYVINHHPELFYVSNSYSYSMMSVSGSNYVSSLYLSYTYTDEELEERMAAFNAEVSRIMAGIKQEWSDLEKALYVYDYFCAHYQYDTTYTKYDAANLFVDKTAVCQGYFLGYEYIMNLLGIENDAAESEEMNHIWNQIKINGKWYNVDVTWGDPIPDRIGRTEHGNFLKSDNIFISNYQHHDWNSSNVCDDGTFDNAFWNDVSSPFVYVDDVWYCVSNEEISLYTCDINNMELDESIKFLGNWFVTGNTSSYWMGVYSGLAEYGGKLYYNTSKEIMSYDPALGSYETIMNGSGTIYGMYMEENIIRYGYADSPNVGVAVSGQYELPIVEIIVRTTGVTLSSSALSLNAGDEVKLTATVRPANATNQNVVWESSDENVATVDSNGNVKAVKAGEAVITAKTADTGKSASCKITVNAVSGWIQTTDGYRYADENGIYFVNKWACINGKWYHFDADGYMQTGWYKEGNAWYYLKSDGSMAVSEWVQNGEYYIDSNGKMVSAGWKHDSNGWWYQKADGTYYKNQWKQISGKWYYFRSSGYAQTGWYKDGDAWYYFKSDCSMAVSEWVDNEKYYVGADGKMIIAGWKQDTKGWWYQNADGTYPKDAWKKIGSKWYHFDKNGYMQTGWYKEGNYYYYLKADGSMAADEYVENGKYYIDSNGHWVN